MAGSKLAVAIEFASTALIVSLLVAIMVVCFEIQLFTTKTDNVPIHSPSQVYSSASVSVVDCAVRAAAFLGGSIGTFYYDDAAGKCFYSESVIANPPRTLYAPFRECPSGDGYEVYVSDDGSMEMCIKWVSVTRVHKVAKSDCENITNGHLILVEDSTMHALVVQVLGTMGTSDVWHDGMDEGNNGTFISYQGGVLSYMPWATGDPDGGDSDCLRLAHRHEYEFKDIECERYSYAYETICQFGALIRH